MITDKRIDGGKGFDWGKTSGDYAKYRDIYPPEFYQKIVDAGLCTNGNRCASPVPLSLWSQIYGNGYFREPDSNSCKAGRGS